MIRTIIITIGISVAAVLLFAASRPGTFHIERKVMIHAAPAVIYPFMSDFRKGQLWVPYEKKDTGMKRSFSGAQTGKGSIYEFEGNRGVGKGRLEIVEATAPSKVVLTLDMVEPIQGHNIVEYTIIPAGSGSEVTWAMSGSCNYIGKLIGIFINFEKMVGHDFSAGLANLKTLAERSQEVAS